MLGKLVDGVLFFAGYKVKTENGWITNPTEEQLKELGYKEVIYSEKPEYDKENERIIETYTDEENITVVYEKVALTDEEHNNIIKIEIEEEENKITSRNIRMAIKGDEFALNKITEIENNIAMLRAKLREEQINEAQPEETI